MVEYEELRLGLQGKSGGEAAARGRRVRHRPPDHGLGDARAAAEQA